MRRVPVDSSPVGRWRRREQAHAARAARRPARPRRARTRTTPGSCSPSASTLRHDTWRSSATATVSATVSDGKRRASWNERPRPRWARAGGCSVGDVDAAEPMRPPSSVGEAGEAVEQRGLAGAVVADEADDLAAAHGQVDVVDRGDAAVALHDAVAGELGAPSACGAVAVARRPPAARGSAARPRRPR